MSILGWGWSLGILRKKDRKGPNVDVGHWADSSLSVHCLTGRLLVSYTPAEEISPQLLSARLSVSFRGPLMRQTP